MSVPESEPPDTYISRSGVIWSSRQLERGAWEHSLAHDPTTEPVVIGGTRYYPVTQQSTFAVEYTVNGHSYEQIASSVKQLHPRDTGGAANDDDGLDVEVQMTFITPGGKEIKVLRADDINRVEPVDSIKDHFPVTATTPRDRAAELEKYASLHPEAVAPAHIIQLLGQNDSETVQASVVALRYIIDERAEECISAIHHLNNHLNVHDDSIARDSLYCLARLAAVAPEEVVFAIPNITEYLTHPSQPCRENALTACVAVGHVDADIITGYEETLTSIVSTGSQGERVRAAKALAEVAEGSPQLVEPYLSELIDCLSGGGRYEEKIGVLSTVGRVAQKRPQVVVQYIDEIASCLDSPHEKLQANAAATLYDVAGEASSAVAEYTDAVATGLDAETSYAKLNATGALARIAKTHPEHVSRHVAGITACLDSEETAVRVNSCYVLKRLGTESVSATEQLTDIALSDPADDVQLQAFEALEEIDDSDSVLPD